MMTISPSKANHLYWLGRYAERVYAQLHFLRYYYDLCLDYDKEDALLEYCSHLSLTGCSIDRDLFLVQHLFDNYPGSLRHCLNCLNDNSIVLREELTTSTISYINLCVATLKHSDHNKDINITNLQPITDYILSFWGSVLHHVTAPATLNMLFIGKHVEYLDMYSRFKQSFSRLATEWKILEPRLDQMKSLVIPENRLFLRELYSNKQHYEKPLPEILQAINTLVKV